MNSKQKIYATSVAVQDQEWSEAAAWMLDNSNREALVVLAAASVAHDAQELTRLLNSDKAWAEIVQRMVCLVIAEVHNRQLERDKEAK